MHSLNECCLDQLGQALTPHPRALRAAGGPDASVSGAAPLPPAVYSLPQHTAGPQPVSMLFPLPRAVHPPSAV